MASRPRITEVTWEAPHSKLLLRRPAAGVVVLVISGTDVGEHGTGPFEELASDVQGPPFTLFIDARHSRGVTVDVSSEWCRWLTRHREALVGVHMLTGSPFVHVTATFVRNFAELTELMRIYTAPAEFERALEAALGVAG
ncbi:MAG TPA: hypothetical protein VGQ57_11465 [Polyangiaceae bacterium]|nr:hypothetical protein [Polyangiaceae bacterium]